MIKSFDEFILEKSYYDFEYDIKPLVNAFIKNDNFYIGNLREQGKSDKEIYDTIYDAILNNKNNFESSIYIDNGKMVIHRALRVTKKWVSNLSENKHIGIYWTWDEENTDTYWGDNDVDKEECIITAVVNEGYIDWDKTYEMNLSLDYESEREIRLFKNSKIQISNVLFKGANIDVLSFKNKVFLA